MKQHCKDMTFFVADDAFDYIVEARNNAGKQHCDYMRVYIREDVKSCCGPAYGFEFAEYSEPQDYYLPVEKRGVGILRVLIDPKWKDILNNVEIVLVDMPMVPMGKGLKIKNPNVRSKCACGN